MNPFNRYWTGPSEKSRRIFVVSGSTDPELEKVTQLKSHMEMLSNVTLDDIQPKPILFIHIAKPMVTMGSSEYENTGAIDAQYQQIDEDLLHLEKDARQGEVNLEIGAIQTAKAVIAQLKRHELTPPQLSWIGNEAVVMLWSLGATNYAITITDGEVGYVARRARQTLRRNSDIKLQDFDLLRLR